MQSGAREAFADRHATTLSQFAMVAQNFGQTIKGDAAVEVMNVMNADIGREPLQDRRHDVMRATVQRRLVQLPILFC